MSAAGLVFGAYVAVLLVQGVLKALNLRHLAVHGDKVPEGFEKEIDSALLARTSRYTLENSRVSSVASVLDAVVVAVFLFGGLLPVYDRWIASLVPSFYVAGIGFFLFIMSFEFLKDIPFSLYRNFVVEKRYGFNTMTFRLWLTDLLKGFLLSTVIGALVIAGALALVRWSPEYWWLWVWGFFFAVTVFLMYLSPYVIEPLFFKFQPVSVEGLEDRIREVLEKADLKVSRVFQMDASRRSRHSNAYFTGVGRVKRIVLFDTLLEQMDGDEVVAVLAHEAGHWKLRHVLKRLIMTEAIALVLFYAAYRLIGWSDLASLVGAGDLSFFGRILVLGFLASLVSFPATPLISFLSRRDEHAADRFAEELTGSGIPLASALVKLSRENLSNLHPHPVYARFYYSHPPAVERVARLRGDMM